MIPPFFQPKLAGPPCSHEDITKFEAFANATLPSDYAAFILVFNGCIPANNGDTFHSPIELPGGNEITVHQLFSLSDKFPPLRSLYVELEVNVEILPITTIPIGVDSFGNVIGLDCESGLLNWTLCEERFSLDYLRNYELGVNFTRFVESLKPGPYMDQE